jgi:hypothetical protein
MNEDEDGFGVTATFYAWLTGLGLGLVMGFVFWGMT